MNMVTIGLGALALIMAKKKAMANDSEESGITVNLNAQELNVPSQYVNKVYLALKKVADTYGKEYAKDIERVMRLETGHFKSSQFKNGYSGGMVASSNTFPYGWKSLQNFAYENGYLPSEFSTYTIFVEREGKNYTYVKFPSIQASILFTAWFIKNVRNGVAKYWNSLDEAEANRYREQLNLIKPRIVNTL